MNRKIWIIFNIVIVLFGLIIWNFVIIPNNYKSKCFQYNDYNLATAGYTSYHNPYNVELIDVGNPYDWNNLDNIKSQDDIYANCSFTSSGYSNYILATNFSFNLLPYYIIEGIYVEINHYTMDYIYWYDIHLWFDDGIVGNTYYGGWIPSIDNDIYDTPTVDTKDWNAGLTPEQINNETFGIYFKYRNYYGFSTIAYIDHIRVYIEYSLPEPPYYENLVIYYNPIIISFNEIIQLDVFAYNSISQVKFEIENLNYSFINIYNDTYYFDNWNSNITGIKEFRIFMIDYYNLTTIITGQINVYNPEQLTLNVLGFITLFIFLALLFIIYYKMNPTLLIKLPLAITIYSFSIFINISTFTLNLPANPYLQIFLLLIETVIFFFICLENSKILKRKRGY